MTDTPRTRSLPVIQPTGPQTSAPPVFEKVAIVGLGLIGGSLALALRETWPRGLVIGVDATRLRPHHVWRCALLVVAILQNIALGLILINVGEAVYDTYATAAAVREWGPTALMDQRIGAGIMWVPGSMMFALAIIITVYYWAEREGFKDRRNDAVRDMQIRVHGEIPTLGPRPGEQ